jgi:subfamily B ATP-binding cassette protein MsbA
MIYKITQRLVASAERRNQNIVRSIRYFSDDSRPLLVLSALMAASTLVGLLHAWPLAVLIDSLLARPASSDWIHSFFLGWLPHKPLFRIAALAGIALILRLLQEVLTTTQRLLNSKINYAGTLRVRCDLFRKLQAMHLDYHRSRPLGDTVFRLTSDTFGCQSILNVLIGTALAAVRIAIMLAILSSLSAALMFVTFLVVPPLVWANVRFGRSLERKTLESKEADSHFLSTVHRAISAVGLTQSFGREQDEFERFGSAARTCVNSWIGIDKEQVGYGLSIGTILGISGALIMAYGSYLVIEQSLTPGDLMVFMTYLGMMYDPLCQLTGTSISLQSGLTSVKRIFEVLDRDTVVRDSPFARSLPVQPRTLTLKNVSFHYVSEKPVLTGVSIDVPPGASIGFAGASGAGKSTLLSLLPRFYDPTQGQIALDGHDIRSLRIKDLRKHVALALQDSVILPTTISENIAYGRPNATETEIRKVADLAGASQFIEQLPEGYKTKLTEGGQNLSGGQRQRIAIARALLTDAPILVLDEPTSSQDGRHEELLRETLLKQKGTRTVILVSHRISTLKDCDLICVLEDGKIKEAGTHQSLLKLKRFYYQLARGSNEFLYEDACLPGERASRPARSRHEKHRYFSRAEQTARAE